MISFQPKQSAARWRQYTQLSCVKCSRIIILVPVLSFHWGMNLGFKMNSYNIDSLQSKLHQLPLLKNNHLLIEAAFPDSKEIQVLLCKLCQLRLIKWNPPTPQKISPNKWSPTQKKMNSFSRETARAMVRAIDIMCVISMMLNAITSRKGVILNVCVVRSENNPEKGQQKWYNSSCHKMPLPISACGSLTDIYTTSLVNSVETWPLEKS